MISSRCFLKSIYRYMYFLVFHESEWTCHLLSVPGFMTVSKAGRIARGRSTLAATAMERRWSFDRLLVGIRYPQLYPVVNIQFAIENGHL